MSKEVEKVHEVEVVAVSSAESQAIVAKCGQRIDEYNKNLQVGERMNDRWRVLIGLELALAKPHLDHGEFKPFIEKRLPQYEYRTAALWTEFAETVISKSDQRSLLAQLPEKAMNGGLSENDLPTLDQELERLTKGKSFRDFIDENAPKKPKGGLRDIKFHCPHCSTENKGKFGREITCANGECKKKIVAKPDVDPEAELKRLREESTDDAAKVSDHVVTLRERASGHEKKNPSAYAAHIDAGEWRRLVSEYKWLSGFIKAGSKLRKKGSK